MMSADTLVESLAEPVATAAEAAAVVITAPSSAISLIPPLVVLAIAIWLKRPILALVTGAIAGLLLLSPLGALDNFAATSLRVMQDETIG